MLKKSDLSKQFELVVQQEIKNYNNSLNEIFQSINSLKDQIQLVENESLENFSLVHSQKKQLEIELELLKKDVSENLSYILSHINDQRLINERQNYKLIDLMNAVEGKIKVDDDFKSQLASLRNEMQATKSQTSQSYLRMESLVDDLLIRFRKELLKTKQEILESPSEASLVKTQLEERIAAHTVDVAGIMREIKHFKNDAFIIDKKLEHIYTLIERLKGKIS